MDELDKCKKVLSFLFKEFGTDKSFHEMVDICYELENTKNKVKEFNDLFLIQKKKAKKFEIIIHEQKSLIKNQDELLRNLRNKQIELIKILDKIKQETKEEKTKQYISLKLNLL